MMNILRLTDFPTKSIVENRGYEIEKYGLGITHIIPLSREFINLKHRISVLAGGGLRGPDHEIVNSIDVYRTKLSMKFYYLLMGPAVLFNMKRIEKNTGTIDVIHAHNPRFTYGYSLLKKIAKKPFVATIHGTFQYNNIEKRVFLRMMKNSVDHFIAINMPSVKILESLGVEGDRISLIPTGVDTTVFKRVREKKKMVLYAGRLVDWKNVDTVINIANILKSTHPEVKFYIVGRGDDEKRIREKVSRLGLESVVFVNNVNYNDMPVFYSRASVFVAPHRYDSFGKTMLEALACETPIVGTGFDVPDDVKKCGVFFDEPDDADGMAEAISTFVDDEKMRKKTGCLGRETVVKNYTWSTCALKTLEVYKRVI